MKKLCHLILFLSCGAYAWADCVDGTRQTTEAERQFYVQTLSSLKSSLPQAPAGWRLEDRTIIAAPTSVCTGSALRATYEVRYYWDTGIAEQRATQQEFESKIVALRQLPADLQKQSDDLGRQSRDLAREARKLIATDKAQADKLMAESQQLARQAHDIRQAHMTSIAPQLTALSYAQSEALSKISTEIRLRIAVNDFSLSVPDQATPTQLTGASIGFASPSRSIYAFGKWNQAGRVLKPVYTAGTSAKAQTVVFDANGSPQQVQQLMAGLDAGAIQTLIR